MRNLSDIIENANDNMSIFLQGTSNLSDEDKNFAILYRLGHLAKELKVHDILPHPAFFAGYWSRMSQERLIAEQKKLLNNTLDKEKEVKQYNW